MSLPFEHHAQKFMNWSAEVFPLATKESSLKKLEEKVREVKMSWDAEEYTDCIMCLLHSAKAAGWEWEDLEAAFARKRKKNAHERKWIFDEQTKTYRHE